MPLFRDVVQYQAFHRFLKISIIHTQSGFFFVFLKRSHPGGSSNEIKPIKLICAPVNSREKSSEKCFLPFGMSEADVVLLSPACKHLFLCNKAMVVSSSAALVLDVCYTFITAPGLVVVVWHLLGSRFSSGKTN